MVSYPIHAGSQLASLNRIENGSTCLCVFFGYCNGSPQAEKFSSMKDPKHIYVQEYKDTLLVRIVAHIVG